MELFALNGLPFGNLPESLRGSMTGPLFIAGLIGAGILVVFQRFFIFQSRLLTAALLWRSQPPPTSSPERPCNMSKSTSCTTCIA